MITTTKKRPPVSSAVPKGVIEQATLALQDLPDKPKDIWTLREAIAQLQDQIADALSRGYSHEEISTVLTGSGVSITASSLKRYLSATKREDTSTPRTKRPRQTAARKSAAPVAPAIAPAAVSVEEPAAPSSNNQTSTRRRKATAEPPAKPSTRSSTRTNTAAKAKPTARTKSSPSRTSTRRRKADPSGS